MSMTILAMKLHVPLPPLKVVARPHLIDRLDAGLSGRLTLVCAPAGFGKSTLLSEWLSVCPYPSAWLSLDEGDSDPVAFLSYMIAALQTISDTLGAGISSLLEASPAPSVESVLSILLNDLSANQSKIVLVLDDYHLAAGKPVDAAVAFLIDHLPSQMHLVIATRDEPKLSLARRRLQGQLTEIRQADLRFVLGEAAGFLNQSMNLQLSPPNIAALETRTEGWIAGLQLAAISLQGHKDPDGFIQSFTGSHRLVQDYLMEEVLRRQPEAVQSFLLCTSVLDRFCGPLCDAVLQDNEGQKTLDYVERSNLFIVPLDNERRWYRYHHLFADLLRQRLRHHYQAAAFHVRASEWYESQGLEIDAFHQAVAATDIPRAMRLIEGNGMPLYFRGEMVAVVHWLQAQAHKVLDAYPSLWVTYAWSLFIAGQSSQVGATLSAAEAALRHAATGPVTQDLFGQIAALWAWSAVSQNNVESIHVHAMRALELLSPENQAARTAAQCALGVALLFRNERAAASEAFANVVSAGKSSGNLMFTVAASIALASIQATNNQLRLAAGTYRGALQMIADPTHLVGCEAHLGLARILYEWNELDDAESHAMQSSKLAARAESEGGSGADALRARLMLLRNDNDSAVTLLAQASESAKTQRFTGRMQEVANVQVLEMLLRGEVTGAVDLATQHQLPLAQAKAFLAKRDCSAALAIVEQYRRDMEEKGYPNEVLKALVMQSITLDTLGKVDKALQVLNEALVLAEPGGFVRIFVDEGVAMATLLSKTATRASKPDYVAKLLGVFALQESKQPREPPKSISHATASPVDSYSKRELEILRLIYQGRSNQEIGERLFLSLSTVKWHNQNIFAKLQVQRRTEAVVRAIELNIMSL